MYKKIQWIMINILPFILIASFLLLPLFNLKALNGDEIFKAKTIFGFHFVSGLNMKLNDLMVQVIVSKVVNLIPIAILIMMFIINKVHTTYIGKAFINFLATGIVAVYIFLLPIIVPTFIGTGEIISDIDLTFTALGPYYVMLVFYILYFIYFIVNLFLSIKREKDIAKVDIELQEKGQLK